MDELRGASAGRGEAGGAGRGEGEGLHIDCDECVAQHTEACDDCVVTFLCGREPDDAVVIDVAEVRALRLLGQGGLVPTLRHRPRTGTDGAATMRR